MWVPPVYTTNDLEYKLVKLTLPTFSLKEKFTQKSRNDIRARHMVGKTELKIKMSFSKCKQPRLQNPYGNRGLQGGKWSRCFTGGSGP